ncbi:MAG: Gfo/Idh/MocA family oxidoreductase [Succinatimonas sp.]|nr:Gfo/Idh/MocA family oxidoreductase [Succinatimonas sp.]
MQIKYDGQNYAPQGSFAPICAKGEFKVGVIGLDHGHIYGMCNGLFEAGASIYKVYDEDIYKRSKFIEKYPLCQDCQCIDDILEDPSINLVAIAAIPVLRSKIALLCLKHGKHVFIDKPAMTSLKQLHTICQAVRDSNCRLFVYFSERLHVEAAVCAEQLIKEGKIGKVIGVQGFGPHRLNAQKRPEWFFDDTQFGGILTDIGCHQIEQILYFGKARDARIVSSRIGNYAHKEYPHFQDYGEVMLECDNGVSGFFRVDWFTPKGLHAWGDGRTFIIGDKGYIEMRKYINVTSNIEGDHVFYVDEEGEHYINASGKYGFPFFKQMIRDILDNTNTAMDQEYIFRVMALAISAQYNAVRIGDFHA